MNSFQRPRLVVLKSSALSLLILLAALAVLWLGHYLRPSAPAPLTVRDITVIVPPPPPPSPPVVRQPLQITALPIQAKGKGPPLQMVEMQQDIEVTMPEAPDIHTEQMQWQPLTVNWDALGLNELDMMPTLLTPLRARFPRNLIRRGITSALVELEILIDKQGKVTLIAIAENPHPELENEIKRLMREARFSTPVQNGIPVRARFILPLEIFK